MLIFSKEFDWNIDPALKDRQLVLGVRWANS